MSSLLPRFLLAAAIVTSAVFAYPIRTHVPLAILLCRFANTPPPTRNVAFYQDMFLNQGTRGLADYWHDVSFANIDFAGSVVKGWYIMRITVEDGGSRDDRFNRCVEAARNDPRNPYTAPSGYRTVVITNPSVDQWGAEGRVFLGGDVDMSNAAHELGHGIGMQHSFSDDPTYRNAPWSQIGEYDDQWDVMSAAHVWTTPSARFIAAPPGLNGYGLDRAGWLPIARTYNFGRDGTASTTVTLAALNHPEVPGYLLVRVPFDPGDLLHYYTIELRTADGWDASIPAPGAVMLHEIKLNLGDNPPIYRSYLLKDSTTHQPLTALSRNGVNIHVNWIHPAQHQASVTITGNIADRCLQGYVWREAFSGDHVCVTPDIRSQAAADNAAAPSRRLPNGFCRQGYVWREANPQDHVCVTPATREQARRDNQAAPSRHNPSWYVFGPTTCAQGYVWREADNSDHVCVTPDRRSQAAADNAAAPSRRRPGTDVCLTGYVWREAFLGDHICVLPSTRAQAAADNAAAASRIAHV